MRRLVLLLAFTAACATRPPPPPSPTAPPPPATTPTRAASPGIEEGASVEAAVLVPPMTEREGVEWENRWIYDHYGRFRKKKVALASREGRHYDVITVELGDHTEKVLYFDITDFFGK